MVFTVLCALSFQREMGPDLQCLILRYLIFVFPYKMSNTHSYVKLNEISVLLFFFSSLGPPQMIPVLPLHDLPQETLTLSKIIQCKLSFRLE